MATITTKTAAQDLHCKGFRDGSLVDYVAVAVVLGCLFVGVLILNAASRARRPDGAK